jgi:hypothetical protein
MDITLIAAVLTGVFGLITGALVAYMGAILKFRKELEAEYDKDLRKERLRVYTNLWSRLDILARFDRPKPLTVTVMRELTESMRKWYFEEGGLYLSEGARGAYFSLKQTIQSIIENPDYQPDHLLGAEDSRRVLGLASTLRAQLTKDVGTRKSSPIADS